MKKLYFLTDFFQSYPSFYYALFFLLGISTFFHNNFILLFFCIFICSKKRLLFTFLVFIFGFVYSFYFFSDLKKINNPIDGQAHIKIKSIKEGFNFNNKYYIYKGFINTFKTNNNTYKNIPISIYSKKFYSSQNTYIINGNLIPHKNHYFILKTKKPWEIKSNIFSLTKTRHDLKKKFKKYLKKTIKDKNSANFLYTLITAENAHKLLSFSFSKIGLQHVLAISGFHFSIFTLFFAFFLRLFLSKKMVVYFLIFTVNFYFLFIGPLISVQRSYIMIQIALFAQVINRKYFAMNALGTSLIITLLFNPLNFTNIGFQLSFLCSFAILLIYPLIEGFSTKLIKKRSLLEKKDLNAISKIAEKLINYLRQCFCLTLSINILILPVVLYHFHKFALISFLYNLFIPFLIGICMILTIIGLIFYFLTPPIGAIVNFINTFFTKYLLKLITYPPTCLQFYIRYKNFSYEAVLIYLIIITLIFLFLRWYLKKGHIPEYIHFL